MAENEHPNYSPEPEPKPEPEPEPKEVERNNESEQEEEPEKIKVKRTRAHRPKPRTEVFKVTFVILNSKPNAKMGILIRKSIQGCMQIRRKDLAGYQSRGYCDKDFKNAIRNVDVRKLDIQQKYNNAFCHRIRLEFSVYSWFNMEFDDNLFLDEVTAALNLMPHSCKLEIELNEDDQKILDRRIRLQAVDMTDVSGTVHPDDLVEVKAKPAPKPAPKPIPKPEPKPEPKVEPKAEPKPQPKPKQEPEPQPEPEPESDDEQPKRLKSKPQKQEPASDQPRSAFY